MSSERRAKLAALEDGYWEWMQDPELVKRASSFHPWDAMTPMALSAIVKRGPFRSTVETGCGGSTIVLSHCSDRHTVFAIDGKDGTIGELLQDSDLRNERAIFVEGETKDTLPAYPFEGEFDLALLDGPHAYPLPQIEFSYLFPRLRLGGWLVVDDIQIPSVYELFDFLRKESSVALEEVVVRTAFFRRIGAVEQGPDGWTMQGINRHTVWRYSWRDRLRGLLGRR
ncbi:MAG: class I SAM-dependent methyltransferase [Bryobacteraceae bacterium]